jgi:hypothetical protein
MQLFCAYVLGLYFTEVSLPAQKLCIDNDEIDELRTSHEIMGQFHQCSTHSFYIRKLRMQLFCAYVLGLYFTEVSLPAQKLCIDNDEI